jgi:hypothetical protein
MPPNLLSTNVKAEKYKLIMTGKAAGFTFLTNAENILVNTE